MNTLDLSNRISKGLKLYQKAKAIIPGGTQLFGKRQEMFAPGQWPAYAAESKGCEVVDVDGNRYIDMMTSGIGATILGYADPDVTQAVVDRVQRGSMTGINPAEEVELAELLLEIHPWADNVRFGRVGGETMTMAVRIARASTKRDMIAICGYHGWHDWYLAANLTQPSEVDGSEMIDRLGDGHLLPGLQPLGVPRGLAGTAVTFSYNEIDQLQRIVKAHGQQLAAIVMESTRSEHPKPGFLESVRDLADQCGARLVFDEISIGWRLCLAGAHLKYGIEPDMAVYAKSLGNGHPMSAVVGKQETMQAVQDTFISSAYWTEAVGPTAALATIKKMMRIDVPAHIRGIGERLRDGLIEIGGRHHVPLNFSDHPEILKVEIDHPEANAIQTLWNVRMLDHGFLTCGGFFPMLAHENHHVDQFLEACEMVFTEIRQAIQQGDVQQRIGGPVKHTGFRRLA